MCLAVPARVVEKSSDHEAHCEVGGLILNVRLDLIEAVAVGEYVLVHAGFAINKLQEPEALETLALLEEAGRFA